MIGLFVRYMRLIGKKNMPTFVWGILLLCLVVVIENLTPLLLLPALSLLSQNPASIEIIFVFLILAFVLSSVMQMIAQSIMSTLLVGVVARGYRMALARLMDQSLSFHISRQTGKLISTFSRIGQMWWVLVFTWFSRGLGVVLSIGAIILVLGSISPVIGWLIALVTFTAAIPAVYLLKKNIAFRTALNTAEDAMLQVTTDALIGSETVYAFGTQQKMLGLLDTKLKPIAVAERQYHLNFRQVDVLLLAHSVLCVGIVLLALHVGWVSVSVATLVVLVQFLYQLSQKTTRVLESIRDILKDIPRLTQVIDLLTLPKTRHDPATPILLQNPRGLISFDQVAFGYGDGIPVISGLSFVARPGTITALVGASGAGKTTIVRLLQRYFLPTGGVVCIDGVDTATLDTDQLHDLIGIVPQDPIFFNTTIRENFALISRTTPSESMMIDACKKACIWDFVQSLPAKLDTQIGERGIRLSGGQRQRLAIARLVLKNPQIILFDEATSALDSESESQIHRAFSSLSRGKTMVIIAHRLSTITHADQILVIQDGTTAEQGTHAELLSHEGQYHKLWSIQQRGFGKG